MTDEYRRIDDDAMEMSPAHQKLDRKIDIIADEVMRHVHPELETHTEQLERIMTILDGPQKILIDGTIVRDEEAGMNCKIDKLLEKRWSWKKITSLVTGTIALIAAAIRGLWT
jgi:hypothetical protein